MAVAVDLIAVAAPDLGALGRRRLRRLVSPSRTATAPSSASTQPVPWYPGCRCSSSSCSSGSRWTTTCSSSAGSGAASTAGTDTEQAVAHGIRPPPATVTSAAARDGRGVRDLRHAEHARDQADGRRPGGGRPDRRHGRPRRSCCPRDDAAGRVELVPAALAALAAPAPGTSPSSANPSPHPPRRGLPMPCPAVPSPPAKSSTPQSPVPTRQ